MKANSMPFVLAAALFCAAGAAAQTPMSNMNANSNVSSDQGQTAPMTKEQKKMEWENGVKADCAGEIAAGGVCADKDFGTGLEKCLHKNRRKLSDGCKAAVHPRRKMMKKGAKGAKPSDSQAAPASAPGQAPTNP
jgi:hypothetical protein